MSLALSYFLLCAAAKSFAACIHGYHWSSAMPLVLLWQDAVAALCIWGFSSFSSRAARTVYWILALHLAACIPLLEVLGTPLTRSLLNAASGALRDSMAHYSNFNHLAPSVVVLLLAGCLPRVLIVFRRTKLCTIAAGSLAFISLAGWWFTPRIEVYGLQRNFAAALLGSYLPRPELSHLLLDVSAEHNCPSAPNARSAAGLNLLIVTLESTGSRCLRTYGAECNPMPRLSTLAREGWVLENAYAPYPESVKGLLSVLASRQPRFGLNESDFSKLAAPSLATVLAAHGYETALFHSGRFMYLGMDALVRSSGFSLAEDAAEIGGERESSFGVDDQQTVDRILRWLDGRMATTPFYIHYLPITGHHPYDAPGPWQQSDDKSRYLNALHYSDTLLSRLLDGLNTRGLLDKTLVLVFGDHGEAFGEHPGNYGHTLFLYDENLRVPVLFWRPGAISAGRCDRPASLVDLAPTVCDLLGVQKPHSFEGLSMLNAQTRPVLFITDYSLRLIGLRDGPWKYIYERDSGFSRLFNLSDDPGETQNLAARNPEKVAQYRAKLLRWNEAGEKLTLARHP